MLAFLLSAIEEYSEAPDIPEGSGASSISDSAMVLPVRWMSTAIVHGSRASNSSTDQGGGKRLSGIGGDHRVFLLDRSSSLQASSNCLAALSNNLLSSRAVA